MKFRGWLEALQQNRRTGIPPVFPFASQGRQAGCLSYGSAVRRFAFSFLCLATLSASAEDWPRWRGPDLNGISRETGWFKPWPKDGPKQLWRANVDQGFSTVSVSQGRVFTAGSRNNRETIFCLDEKTGSVVWKQTYATKFEPEFYEGGSSGTPTADGAHVFFLGQMGELFCFDAATGRVAWSNNIAKTTSTKIYTWGLTGAPLVQGDALILNVGGAGTAVEKSTGKVLWTSSGEGAYATPLPLADRDEVLIFSIKELLGVNPKTGAVAWRYPWETQYEVNAADPVLAGRDRVFVSSAYGRGCALIEIKNGRRPERLWENKNMRTHFNPCVLLNGHLFGIDGDAGSRGTGLRCIDVVSGAAKWFEGSIGSGALTAADNKLIIISDKGEVVIAEASGEKFAPLARAQVLGGKCWTAPVLANGRIFCRNSRGDLVRVDARGGEQ